MTKRAAIIITDAEAVDVVYGFGYGRVAHTDEVPTSEQLLADLRTTVHLAETRLLWNEEGNLSPKTYADWTERVARVRALLPKEDDHE